MRLFACLLVGVSLWLSGCGSQAPAPSPADEKPAPRVVVQVPATTTTAPKRPVVVQKVILPSPQPKIIPDAGPAAPPDSASKEVSDFLRPSEAAFAPKPARSHLLAGPRGLEQPDLPPAAYAGSAPKLPSLVSSKPLLPRPLPQEMPLAHEQTDQRLPSPIKLPTGSPVRVAGPDVQQTPPLPILARPQSGSGSVTDPTAEASQAAALAAPVPVRTRPAPFDRPSIPDPFENRHAVHLHTPPPKTPLPPQVLPRFPSKSL
jgi:hypothetical protein